MEELKIDLSKYKRPLSRKNQIGRLTWSLIWTLFARPFPRSFANCWKVFLLRMFGAKIGKGAVVYSSASIWAPWNLIMGDFASIADNVICYNVDKVSIGSHTTISQYTYLCTASHNIEDLNNALVTAPIFIKSQAWVAAGAYVNMGVTIGEGAVVGARACVFKNVESWTIVGGNPAVVIKQRTI